MHTLAINAAIALYGAAAALLNTMHDTPHIPESRPNYAEACWATQHEHPSQGYTDLWLEIATPTGHVCDGTGTILYRARLD